MTYVVQSTDLGTTVTNVGTADGDQTGPAIDSEAVPVPDPCLAAEKVLTSNADKH